MALNPRKPLSRPVIVKTLTINTLQGTKAVDRVLHRTIRALFSTSVILR
ncbi:MAG: hypothetical protein HQL38_01625, partial [Alphaproteobacteria bacterium]|nr:hypothetical protein [Alphaproteobacteria bacterium]